MIRCGHPRTDVLFKTWPKYDFGAYKKLVIWTPTYRKYKKTRWGMGVQVENEEKILPLILVKEFEDVNKYLQNMGVKIVVKLHPMQSLEQYHIVNMVYHSSAQQHSNNRFVSLDLNIQCM